MLCSFFLDRRVEEKENKLLHWINMNYSLALDWAMKHKKQVVTIAITTVLVSLALFPFLGSEFIPRLDEEALVAEAGVVGADRDSHAPF